MKPVKPIPCVLAFGALMLSACNGGLITSVGPDYRTPPLSAAPQWHARQPEAEPIPLAHRGSEDDLLFWWRDFQDPVLSGFIESAEQVSDSIASARGRIAQSRAGLVTADTAMLPTLDGSAGANESSFSLGGPAYLRKQYQVGLQSNWEIDLFGGLARQKQASESQLQSRQAAWHDARVAVAVETANAYLSYRYCEIQVRKLQDDADSRNKSLDLIGIAAQYGFRSSADAAMSRASAAEGMKNLLQQQGQCDRSIKGLTALTGLDESLIREKLADPLQQGKLPAPPAFKLDAIPAKALRQRPDLAAAERDMAEASAKIGVELAKRYPKLSLSGNITPSLQSMSGSALAYTQTWSLGPTLTLPLFDAGKRAADVDAAKVQYEASISTYRAKVRTAVREVEEALVRLDNAARRLPEARRSAQGYDEYFLAGKQLFESGLGSLLDLEIARRNRLTADLAVKDIEQEQVSAWIALYRAVGGRWDDNSLVQAPPADTAQENTHD